MALAPPMKELLDAARAARQQSFAPYSNFLVGAAVRGASGRIYTGSNVEVTSYGLTMCAERLAIFTAGHEVERELKAIALIADTVGIPGPCGACRQLMVDFALSGTVLMSNLEDQLWEKTVEELVPWSFGPDQLTEFNERKKRRDE